MNYDNLSLKGKSWASGNGNSNIFSYGQGVGGGVGSGVGGKSVRMPKCFSARGESVPVRPNTSSDPSLSEVESSMYFNAVATKIRKTLNLNNSKRQISDSRLISIGKKRLG